MPVIFFVLGMAVSSCLFAQTGGAAAARKALEVDKLTVKPVSTPSFTVGTDSVPGKKKAMDTWIEIRSEYRVNPEWIDSAQFKYFIAMEAQQGGRHLPADARGSRINVITGDVTYEDLPQGKGQLSTMYLSPTKVVRYGKPIGWRVEVYVSGQLVHGDEKVDARLKQTPGWQSKNPRRLLLNRSQTPWSPIDRDSFNDIKTDTAR